MSESLMYSTAWCGVYMLTPYTPVYIMSESLYRMSESLMYSTAWRGMYILTPYTPVYIMEKSLHRMSESLMYSTLDFLTSYVDQSVYTCVRV